MSLIAVNARSLGSNITGVQRYTIEVLAHLGDRVIPLSPEEKIGRLRGHLWEQLVLPVRLGGRFLWSPSNTGPLLVTRQAVTIHDASVLDHPEWFDEKFSAWYKFLLPKLASRVRHIITDSNFSKHRLLAHLPVREEDISVIYPAVDARFHPFEPDIVRQYRERIGLPERYILFVGSLEPRKNLTNLLNAWKLVNFRQLNATLVIAGAEGHVFRQTRQRVELANTRFLGYVSDSDLPMLYNSAEAFIYPSIYEGFGLPILEAMACGTPVLTTRRTSIPEVAGDSVIYIEPDNLESIAEAIATVLDDEHLRQTLISSGFEQRQKFHWNKTAAAIWSILEKYDQE